MTRSSYDANAQGIGWVSPETTLNSALELAEHNGKDEAAHILRTWKAAHPAPSSDDDAASYNDGH